MTFRLAGSLPRYRIEQLRTELQQKKSVVVEKDDCDLKEALRQEDKRHFARFDKYLDQADSGPTWLADEAVASLVYESILYRDGNTFDLDAFTIMPNHVHIVLQPRSSETGLPYALPAILMSLKRYTARKCNEILGRQGQFWQHESYDHVIRDLAEWERIIAYVLNNPVTAGLAETWESWRWTYLRE